MSRKSKHSRKFTLCILLTLTDGSQEGEFEFFGCYPSTHKFLNPVAVSSVNLLVDKDGHFSVDLKSIGGEILEDLIVFCRNIDGQKFISLPETIAMPMTVGRVIYIFHIL